MNNLFGIGILLELKDKVSQKLTALSRSLDDVQSEADETVRSMNKLDGVLKSGSSFELTSRESQTLTNMLEGTSRSAESFQRRMERMSYYLGGDMSESTKTAYATMYALRQEVKNTSRQYGRYSIETMEARNRLHEFALSMDDNTFKQVYMRSELGLTGIQLQQQANSIKLNARMTKLMSSQTEILTRRMQGLQQAGVTPEMLMPPSTPGQFQILNETIKASHSPLYKLTGGYRSLGGSIEKVLKGYSAQKVAIRMANGDMVRYGLLQRGITAGVANLGLAFPVMGAMAVAGYGALVSAVIEADDKLKELIDTVGGKVVKAFEPMTDIIKSVVTHIAKFVGKVADMIIAFNKAHPLCSKIIQGFALMLPALTLLLLPLGMIPIGLNAFAVALNSLWTLIGPFVAGIGTASAMALGFAGVLGTLTLVLANLWKHNEKFRNAITNTANTIKSMVISAFEKFKTIVQDLGKAFDEGGVAGVIQKLNSMFQSLVATATEKLPQFIQKGAEIVVNILEGIATNLPKVYEKGRELLQKVLQGIVDVLPQLIESGAKVLEVWLNAMVSNISLVLNMGLEIVMALIEGIMSVLPQLVQTGITVLTTFGQMIIDNLPMILDAGIRILNTLIEAIVSNIPMLINTATEIINSFVSFISENLPILINAGIEILMTLVNAIIDNLPMLIECGIQVINTVVMAIIQNLPLLINAGIQLIGSLVTAILNNLPQLLSAGVQLVLSVVNGIVQSLPQILSAGGQIISSLFRALMQGLPQLLSAGLQLVGSVAKGIISGVGQAVSGMGQVLSSVVRSAVSFGSQFVSIGSQLISGLIQGIKNGAKAVVDAISGVVQGAISGAKKLLGIKSPSRVFKQIGAWTSEGMAIGVDNNAPLVNKSIEDMGRSAVKQADTIIKHDFVFNQEPIQPLKQDLIMERKPLVEDSVISPVVQPRIQQEQLVGQDLNVNPVVQSLGEQDLKVKPIVEPLGEQDLKVNPIMENDLKVKPMVDSLQEQDLKIKPIIEPIMEQDVQFNSIVEPLMEQELKVKPIIEPLEEQELKVKPLQEQELNVNTNNSMNDINKVSDNKKVNDTMTSIGNKVQVAPVESAPSTNVTNHFTIQMDVKGTESPRELVDQIMTELQRRTQLRNVLAYR